MLEGEDQRATGVVVDQAGARRIVLWRRLRAGAADRSFAHRILKGMPAQRADRRGDEPKPMPAGRTEGARGVDDGAAAKTALRKESVANGAAKAR